MKHLIITCSDARYGDFLVEHWLPSLQENVNLEGIDIAVVDYGLSEQQRSRLLEQGVQVSQASPDGNITNIRYRDITHFLRAHPYDQVMAVDGGDLIFQSDIRSLFEEDKDSFRGVCEQREVPFHDLLLPTTDMSKEDYQRIFRFLQGKKTINGGMLLGPAIRYGTLWDEFSSLCSSLDVFGTDQLVLNYLMYRDGFKELDSKYNFVIMTIKSPFSIRQGKFYDQSGDLIPIVHNAGMRSLTRCVAKFGYGADRNKRKWLMPIVLHSCFAVLNFAKRLRLFPSQWGSSRAGNSPQGTL